MNIKEKLAIENPDEDVIRLYHEGIFYTAYGYSAVRVKKQIHPDVCLIRQMKKDGFSYFRIGIVQSSPILAGLSLYNADGSFVSSITIPYTGESFGLDTIIPDKVIGYQNNDNKKDKDLRRRTEVEAKVLADIRTLDMTNLTPVKAMQQVLYWWETLNKEEYG